MKTTKRALLLLNCEQHISEWQRELEAFNWKCLIANTPLKAHQQIQKYQCKVCLALVTESNHKKVYSLIADIKSKTPNIKCLAIVDKNTELTKLNWAQSLPRFFTDFHHNPVDWKMLNFELGHALGIASLAVNLTDLIDDSRFKLIGNSNVMQQVQQTLVKFANCEQSVLLNGETGTGKDLCAQIIHLNSPRRGSPFITINCGALPPSLIHSELFGHEKGAFTSADSQYIGHIERANNGTLFLDEIGDLPLALQVNLLHFLETHRIERLGGHKEIQVNCRIIFATHINLQNAIVEGKFREDLYHRINILQLTLPSLREHIDDLELLAEHFLKLYSKNEQTHFTKSCLKKMKQYEWPGNVRELSNRIQRAIIMTNTSTITETDLALPLRDASSSNIRLLRQRADINGETLLKAMRNNNHNISAAARELKISRTTFYRLLKKCNIQLNTCK